PHPTMIAISWSGRLGALAKLPTVRSAGQGGMRRVTTRSLIARANGRASWYVRGGIGATSPGRWHPTHFSCRIGATSRVKVTSGAAAGVARGDTHRHAAATNAADHS